MTKVPPRNGAGNRGAGTRRNEGDPFADLRGHVRDWMGARGAANRKASRNELSVFVENLSTEERRRVRLAWWKAPRHAQQELHRALVDALGGSFGPASVLLSELLEDIKARADRLPDPLADKPERSTEEWTERLLAGGVPESEAKALAADLTRSVDETVRAFYLQTRATPEAAAAMVAEDRRARKWSAAINAIAGERLAAGDHDKELALRPRVEKAAQLAARFREAAAELGTCVQTIALDRRQISRYYSPGPDSVPWWFGFGDELDRVADGSDKLAGELRDFAEELAQPAGAPKNDVIRSAAEKLKALRLEHQQIAEVLVTTGVARDGYTKENVRDALRAGKKIKGAGTPGRKGRRSG